VAASLGSDVPAIRLVDDERAVFMRGWFFRYAIWLFALLAWLCPASQKRVQAQGLIDCQIDLVFIVDTSPSMGPDLAQACIDAERISSGLQTMGYDVTRHVISVGNGAVTCADTVCAYPCDPTQPDLQSWGEAALYWAQHWNGWRPCAARILLPIADAGMDCGCPVDNADDLLLAQLVAACHAGQISAFPLSVPGDCETALVASMEVLAQSTGGRKGE